MAGPQTFAVHQRGVTLMEMIIVLVVMAFLAAVGSTIFVDSFLTTKMVNSSQSTQNQARYAVERLAREVRQIKYTGNAPLGNYSFITPVTASGTSMTFTNVINGADQTVAVSPSDTNLMVSYGGGPAVVLCQNAALTINYLKLDNTQATTTNNVRFVVLNLTVSDPTSGQAVTERIRVALRSS